MFSVQFDTEPPANIRKSNFFNFSLRVFSNSLLPLVVEKASFVSFCDLPAGCNNGVQYRLLIVLADQRLECDLYVRLVDSRTRELIHYEGTARDPSLQRVLLTHRALCSRCAEGKVCGNKTETPSSPVIQDEQRLKFFLKCSQNCLRGAGNPKTSRRFMLMVSNTADLDVLCLSREMFVHNNSKHAKPRGDAILGGLLGRHRESKVESEDPLVLAISPSEGWSMGGQTIVIIGENFCEGLHVIFGSQAVYSQLINRHALRVQSPPHQGPGSVSVSLALGSRHFSNSAPGSFTYLDQCLPSLDYGFARLGRLVPRVPGDPVRLPCEVILRRAAEMVEAVYYSQEHPSTDNISWDGDRRGEDVKESLLQ